MIFLHSQTPFVVFSTSEQEIVVIKMEQTPRVMHLTSNNLINSTQKKQAKKSLTDKRRHSNTRSQSKNCRKKTQVEFEAVCVSRLALKLIVKTKILPVLGIRTIDVCIIPFCMQLVGRLEKVSRFITSRLFSQFWTSFLAD